MQRKNIGILSLIILLCAQLSAHSGMFWGEKNLRVVKTQWFDIIYPERCEETAAILFEKADTVYQEVTAQYGLTPSFRMPVVITPAVEQFNAFWTAVPYNHIALYDTGASGSSELAVFSETMLSTFRHELTHAVTYNMKDGFWRGVGKVIGDCVAPGMLSVTTGMAEGATVTSESMAGEGRLNDEYAKHYVKQAKIEDKFPSYHDVSGAADVQPGGAPYFFNGAFHGWLQEKYGLEPYAKFWYRVVNGKNFTIAGAFKKAYGIKLRKAWAQFVEDYEVPDVAANPVKAGIVQDFFEPESNNYSRLNDAGSVYASLSASDVFINSDGQQAQRLIWLDRYGARVFTATAAEGVVSKPKHLFSLMGISEVKVSNDGRFIAASYYSQNAAADTARVKIYDIENGSFFSVKETGLKEAAVIKSGDEWYLVAQKYFAQHYSISVSKLIMIENGKKIKAVENVSSTEFPAEVNPFAFCRASDGFACLIKDRMSFSLCVFNLQGEQILKYSFPQGMAVRSLSYVESKNDDGVFYYSYATKGTLPRLGKLYTKNGLMELSEQNISGGVFEPVFWGGKVVYIGEFFRQNRILCMDAETEGAAGLENSGSVKSEQGGAETSEPNPNLSTFTPGSINALSKSYNPLPYLTRGIFIPFTTYKSEYFGSNADYSSNLNQFYYGITYITSNPWTDGNADLYVFTGGWNPLSNSFGAELEISRGTETSLFKYSVDVKSEFDSKGWKQSGGELVLSTGFYTGNISYITLSNTAVANIGKQDKRFVKDENDTKLYHPLIFWHSEDIGLTAPEDDAVYSMLQDVATLQLSTLRRGGPGRFARKGFAVAVSGGTRYDFDIEKPEEEIAADTVIAAAFKLCIPHLLPFESKYGFTYNLPLALGGSLLPTSSNYAYTYYENTPGRSIFDANVEATLFSIDVQMALPGITAVYFNDFYISAGYAATGAAGSASKDGFQPAYLGEYFEALGDGRGHYLDSVYIKSGIEITPNIGVFARSGYKMNFYYLFTYTLNAAETIKPIDRARLSIGFEMN